MNEFSPLKQFTFFEIEVSEKIKDKNLKNFFNSSLKINDIALNKTDKIYLNFITELSLYQVFLLKNKYKYFDFQVFELFYENQIIKNQIDLYICDDFFCLYKNGFFYYFQNISLKISIEEFIEYLNKKLKIKIENYKQIDNKYLDELKELYQRKKITTTLKNINLKKDYSFSFYLGYVFFIILSFFIIFLQKNKIENSEILNKIEKETINNKYLFFSLEEKLDYLLRDIKLNNLKLIKLEYRKNDAKVILNSFTKENIYQFFENNRKNIISSSINFQEEKNLYEVIINVKIFE